MAKTPFPPTYQRDGGGDAKLDALRLVIFGTLAHIEIRDRSRRNRGSRRADTPAAGDSRNHVDDVPETRSARRPPGKTASPRPAVTQAANEHPRKSVRGHACSSATARRGKYTCYGVQQVPHVLPEAFFDQHTARTLERIAIDDRLTDFLLHELGDWYDETTRTQTTSTERLRNASTSYRGSRLQAMTRSSSGARRRRMAIAQRPLAAGRRRVGARARRKRSALQREEFLAVAHRPIELAQTAERQYLTQNATEKREVLRTLLSNCTMQDGSLSVTMRSPFDVLAKLQEGEDWLGDRESNPD
jgi:hypothetical protein